MDTTFILFLEHHGLFAFQLTILAFAISLMVKAMLVHVRDG